MKVAHWQSLHITQQCQRKDHVLLKQAQLVCHYYVAACNLPCVTFYSFSFYSISVMSHPVFTLLPFNISWLVLTLHPVEDRNPSWHGWLITYQKPYTFGLLYQY